MRHKNKESLFQRLKNSRTHSTRNISLRLFFHQRRKSEGFWNSKVLKIQAVPIPSGGLEVPLLLKFSAKDKWVVDTMEEFVLNFYSYEYSGNLSIADNEHDDEDDDDYEAIMIELEETDSQETEAQSEIQETKSQETETESQLSNTDLQINEDID